MIKNILYHEMGTAPVASEVATRVQAQVTDGAQVPQINADGGLRMWIVPKQSNTAHCAWNTILVQCEQFVFAYGDYSVIPEGAVQYDVTIGSTAFKIWKIETLPTSVSLTLKDNTGGTIATLKADTMQGRADFDVAPFLRSRFGECEQPAQGAVSVVDYSLFCHFRIGNVSSQQADMPYVALNAVAQVGESSAISIDDGITAAKYKILNEERDMIRFKTSQGEAEDMERVPFIVVLAGDADKYYYKGSARYVYAHTAQRIYVRSNSLSLLDIYFGAAVTYREQVLCDAVPIRWVNRYGATEQHIFSQRQYIDREVKTAGLRETYDERGTNRAAYKVTADKTMRVGLENVQKAVFDILTGIAVSPKIEYYDTERGMWIGLTCKNYEHTEQRDANAFAVEFEFNLPRVNLQFE